MVEHTAVKISAERLSISFSAVHALKDVSMDIYKNEILTVIGPANSGKTSFLRALNRLNDLAPHIRTQGDISLDGEDIKRIKADELRRRVGMIFALPMPLPLSIYDNIAYGPRMHGIKDKAALERTVEEVLNAAFLWDEVKDRLNTPAMNLSGGQQQRLCIARTLAVRPEVLLLDEPCSGLDPISTAKVEETMFKLKENYTLVLVTNNTKQAARVGMRTAFFLMGELVEVDKTEHIFKAPLDKRTEDYIEGRFG